MLCPSMDLQHYEIDPLDRPGGPKTDIVLSVQSDTHQVEEMEQT